jgi:hypothetical protein
LSKSFNSHQFNNGGAVNLALDGHQSSLDLRDGDSSNMSRDPPEPVWRHRDELPAREA